MKTPSLNFGPVGVTVCSVASIASGKSFWEGPVVHPFERLLLPTSDQRHGILDVIQPRILTAYWFSGSLIASLGYVPPMKNDGIHHMPLTIILPGCSSPFPLSCRFFVVSPVFIIATFRTLQLVWSLRRMSKSKRIWLQWRILIRSSSPIYKAIALKNVTNISQRKPRSLNQCGPLNESSTTNSIPQFANWHQIGRNCRKNHPLKRSLFVPTNFWPFELTCLSYSSLLFVKLAAN